MSFFEKTLLIHLLGSLIILLEGFYVLLKGEKRELNRAFFLMTVSGGIWGLGGGLWKIFGISNPHAWIYFRFLWIGIAFLGPSFLHTTILISKKERKIPLWLLYLPSFATLFFIFTPYFLIPNPYPKLEIPFLPSPLFRKGFTFSFLIYLFLGEILLILKYFSSKSRIEKEKVKYYFLGSIFAIIVAGVTNVYLPFKGLYIQNPYGFLAFVIGFAVAGYGITKKGLIVDYGEILESIFQKISDLALTVDSDGIIILVGENTLSRLGYKKDEIENHYLFEFLAEKEKEKRKIWSKIKKEKKIVGEKIRLLAKNKEEVPYLINTFFLKDRIMILGKDIREVVKTSEELEKKVKERTKDLQQKTKDLEKTQKALMNILEDVEEERERVKAERDKTLAIINNFTDGLILLNKEKEIVMLNPQAEKMFGMREKEVKGKNIFDLKNPLISPAIKVFSEKGKIKKVERKEFSPREGKTIEVTTVPLKETGWLIIFHDISREKIIEKLKTEFVSISAHQLRTPLSAIKWTLRMLLDGDLGKITKEQREFLEKTYRSNERMIKLINDLLNVTRIEEGRFIYKRSLVDFRDVVGKIIETYRDEISRKEIRLKYKKPKEKFDLFVDEEKISLAVQNLIDNAIRYTPQRGEIEIELKKGEKEILFKIKDSGIGIPEDQKERIFQKFFRAANAMRFVTEGTGLGLFITKNIIEAHGGKIWFESKEGKGTTFYFTLPIK